jgi:hypothetical protein
MLYGYQPVPADKNPSVYEILETYEQYDSERNAV